VSIVLQLIIILAAAELAKQFEHRLLNETNIILTPTCNKSVVFKVGSHNYEVPTKGYYVSVADYSASRIRKANLTVVSATLNADTLSLSPGKEDLLLNDEEIEFLCRNQARKRHRPDTTLFYLSRILDYLLQTEKILEPENYLDNEIFLQEIRRAINHSKSTADLLLKIF